MNPVSRFDYTHYLFQSQRFAQKKKKLVPILLNLYIFVFLSVPHRPPFYAFLICFYLIAFYDIRFIESVLETRFTPFHFLPALYHPPLFFLNEMCHNKEDHKMKKEQ